jgi:2-amino-4-hydroxy-6-hydroxymethyldihydropteridine diphosphokinase
MNTAYVALGANLGDPAATVRAALAALANLPESRVSRSSSLYRTAPVGPADQPDFINAVAELETGLAPEALLAALLDIERRFGRLRGERNGPRTLDLDLLLYAGLAFELPALTLPHPRMHLRAFVLQPLAEIAPHLEIPGRGTLAAWLPAVANQGIVRL